MSADIEHVVREPSERTHATPILLQHGAWHGAWCWERFLDEFAARGYETHAISLPGHGGSGLDGRRINQVRFRDYVACLRDAFDGFETKPVVVGHSMGGAITQALLRERALPGAVLLASVPHFGVLPLLLRWLRSDTKDLLTAMARRSFYAMVRTPDRAARHFLGPEPDVDPEWLHERLCEESFRAGLWMQWPWNLRPKPGVAPCLVIAAEKDAIFTVDEEESLSRAWDAPFTVVPGQGHDLMLEPEWRSVVDRIDHWITNDLRLA